MLKGKVAIYDCYAPSDEEVKNKYYKYIAAMEKEIESNPKYELVGTFHDDCSEATPIAERLEFRKVVEKVRNNEVDVLACMSRSVFGRNLVNTLAVVHSLEDSGVRVKFGSEILESSGIDIDVMSEGNELQRDV